jgi:hypothetical protein
MLSTRRSFFSREKFRSPPEFDEPDRQRRDDRHGDVRGHDGSKMSGDLGTISGRRLQVHDQTFEEVFTVSGTGRCASRTQAAGAPASHRQRSSNVSWSGAVWIRHRSQQLSVAIQRGSSTLSELTDAYRVSFG